MLRRGQGTINENLACGRTLVYVPIIITVLSVGRVGGPPSNFLSTWLSWGGHTDSCLLSRSVNRVTAVTPHMLQGSEPRGQERAGSPQANLSWGPEAGEAALSRPHASAQMILALPGPECAVWPLRASATPVDTGIVGTVNPAPRLAALPAVKHLG